MEPWTLNLRHLRAFCETCRLGSVASVARKIHLSQPAVTQAISKLEQQLDISLFDRSPQGMTATDAANLIRPRIEDALEKIGSNNITSAQVRAFIALSRTSSYSEASILTGLATATLHRSIADLEITVSRKLLERRGRGIEITTRGKSLARKFRLAEAELSSALNELAGLKGNNQERIAIGAMPLCRARLLPAAVISFQKAAPDVEIVIAEGAYAELIEPLRDGELDILIGALRPHSPGPDVSMDELFIDQPVVIARKGHPLDELDREISFEELSSFPWIIPPGGAPLRQQWDKMMDHRSAPTIKVPVECSSVIAARQILMGTDYLTVLSPDQVAVELEAGWLSIISKTPRIMARRIGIYSRSDWRPTNAQREFIEQLKHHARDY